MAGDTAAALPNVKTEIPWEGIQTAKKFKINSIAIDTVNKYNDNILPLSSSLGLALVGWVETDMELWPPPTQHPDDDINYIGQ